MKKSEAIKEAAIKLAGAADTVESAAQRLSGIRSHAITDGYEKQIIRRIRNLMDIARELRDMGNYLDFDVDETKTIKSTIKNDEEV
jgi:hypothetical protein